MYSLVNCLEELELTDHEYGYMTDPRKFHGSESFNIYVPKLMAGISMGVTSSWTVPVTTGAMFINSPETKPSPASTTSMQNYITIFRQTHTDFSMRADPNDDLLYNQKFIVNFMNMNPKDYKLERVM